MFNKLYPVRPLAFIGLFCLSLAYLICGDQHEQSLTLAFGWSLGFALLPVFVLRAFLWLFFFRYKGYVFENPKQPSLTTKFWFTCSKILQRFAPPRLETCDPLLPRQPVPHLKDTIARYLESMKRLVSEVDSNSKLTIYMFTFAGRVH
ncbi:MAG: hypothetical protein DI539_31250 [Flavobacterium psychrophilum]|nr:MAG: hypothetical protein DI539_31250 [Flavobacterium psychrophilum]